MDTLHCKPEQSLPSMMGISQRAYGAQHLRLTTLPIPTAKAGEVLIRIQYAALNPLDVHVAQGEPYLLRGSYGLTKPTPAVRGTAAVGVVAGTGEGVDSALVGRRVVAATRGAFANYAIAKQTNTVVLEDDVSAQEAVTLPVAATTALQAFRCVERDKVQRILVHGGAGNVGSWVVQLAHHDGLEVDVVARPRSDGWLQSRGVTRCLSTLGDAASLGSYDVIFDTTGAERPSRLLAATVRGGTLVLIGAKMTNPWVDPFRRIISARAQGARSGRRVIAPVAELSGQDIATVLSLLRKRVAVPPAACVHPLDAGPSIIRSAASGALRGRHMLRTETASSEARI